MYAIIEAGGLQFRVAEGDTIRVPAHVAEPGASYRLERVLMIGDGDSSQFGKPIIEGAAVEASVVAQGRDKKVLVFKKKRRTKYRKMCGHRQDFTDLKIGQIIVG